MVLYESLRPLLPSNAGNFQALGSLADANSELVDADLLDTAGLRKRGSLNMNFMGKTKNINTFVSCEAGHGGG